MSHRVDEDTYFAEKLLAFQARIDDLIRNEAVQMARQNPLVKEALEELQNLLEELQVAREELHQKNDQFESFHEATEAQRQRYQDLFQFAPDGYLVTNESGNILEANQAAARMLNLSSNYLIGKPILNYLAVIDRRKLRLRLLRFRETASFPQSNVESWEMQLKPRKGEPFWALFRVASAPPGLDEGPGSYTLRWMIHDITPRAEAQQALQVTREELENRVAERTAELLRANEKLEVVALQLENRNRELQDFAFIASHDLQEPLRKIQAFGERLKARLGDGLDGEAADFLNRMFAASGRMQAMIDGLLNYARVTTRAEPFTSVSLAEVARDVVEDLEISIARTHGQVELGDLPIIQADGMQMYQLLQNLIANALKFHQPGEPPYVKVWGEQAGPEHVRIGVQDRGIGIEPEHRKRLFKPFQRLHGKSEFEGSGMGLAICQRIVERHGGIIDFTSTPGEGTTFWIILGVKPD